jgi:hypothetical protein
MFKMSLGDDKALVLNLQHVFGRKVEIYDGKTNSLFSFRVSCNKELSSLSWLYYNVSSAYNSNNVIIYNSIHKGLKNANLNKK